MRTENFCPAMPGMLLLTLSVVTVVSGAERSAGPRYRHGTYFQQDVFARHYSYEDLARQYEYPRFWHPPYYDHVGYHYRLRYYRIGTFHHYHPMAPYAPPPHRRFRAEEPFHPRFPFFPHRSYGPRGQFWWEPERRHRRLFWRVVRRVEQPDHPYRQFFLPPR